MPEHSDAPFYKPRGDYDYVYVLDAHGWYLRYAHLQSIDPAVQPGVRVKMGQKIGVLEQRCDEVGRDPATIRKSAQALLFLSDDASWLQRQRDRQLPMPSIIGTVEQVRDIVRAYVDAGVDELIVPDFTLGPPERKRATLDRFIEDVAVHF